MTQYPAPYSPPPLGYSQPYWDPTRDLLAPARRASMFMFVYGGLLMLCGGCTLANAAFMRSPETMQQMREMFPNVQLPSVRETAITASVLLLASILFIILGAWVRNGRRGAVVTSIVFVGLILLWQAFSLLSGLLIGVNPAAIGVSLCISTVLVIVPMAVLLVWLVPALRNSGQLDAARAYAQQYWQYAQQYPQQGYPQPGHGGMPYGQQGGEMVPAPPPPPLPPSEPPAQA